LFTYFFLSVLYVIYSFLLLFSCHFSRFKSHRKWCLGRSLGNVNLRKWMCLFRRLPCRPEYSVNVNPRKIRPQVSVFDLAT
jgi:hypothetical protein